MFRSQPIAPSNVNIRNTSLKTRAPSILLWRKTLQAPHAIPSSLETSGSIGAHPNAPRNLPGAKRSGAPANRQRMRKMTDRILKDVLIGSFLLGSHVEMLFN